MPEKHLIDPAPSGSTPCTTPCNTPYSQEESEERGGAAVMRMILSSQKVGLNPAPTQQTLFNDAVTRNDTTEPTATWHIDPQGLRESLMFFKPASFANIFVNYSFPATDLTAANAKLVFTIDNYEVAPAVVAATGPQWVAVVGYRTASNGALQSVFLNDPRPPLPQTGDPPDFEVAAEVWGNQSATGAYLRPVSGGTRWRNQFTMVCDPDPPVGKIETAREEPLARGEDLIRPEEAVDFANRLLETRGSLNRPLFERAVRDGTPAEPQLVRTLARGQEFYYLVRYQLGEGDAGAVTLDARFGTFIEAIAFPEPRRLIGITPEEILERMERGFPLEEPTEDVRERILGHVLGGGAQPGAPDASRLRELLDLELTRLREPLGRVLLRREEVTISPVMVWQPCFESISHLYPFYQVNIPGDQLYVRAADGLFIKRFGNLFLYRLGG